MRVVLALACIACAAVVLASPASAKAPVKPAVWATTVCTDVAAWKRQVLKSANRLQTDIEHAVAAGGLRGARTTFIRFFDGLVTVTAHLQGQLASAGTPSGPHGKQAVTIVRGVVNKAHALFATAKVAAAKLSVTSATAFDKQTVKLAAALTKAAGAIDSSGLGSSLNGAIPKVKACSSLG